MVCLVSSVFLVSSWNKSVLGDALTQILTTATVHQNIHEEKLVATMAGIFCTNGEFHTQMNLGKLIGKTFDNGVGHGSAGTFQNLKKAIGRTAASGKWKNTFSEDERLLNDVVSTHITGFAIKFFGMSSIDSKPTKNSPSPTEWKRKGDTEKRVWLHETMMKLLLENIWTFSLDHVTETEIKRTPDEEKEHQRTEIAKKIHCRFCNHAYIYPKSLKDHERKTCRRKQPIPNDEEFRIYHCPCCNAGYTTEAKCKQHAEDCVESSVFRHAQDSRIATEKNEDGKYNYARRLTNEGTETNIYSTCQISICTRLIVHGPC